MSRPSQTPGASTDGADRRSIVCPPRQSSSGAVVRRQSFFQATLQPAGVPRDPRPLKDRSFQARIGQELLEYMASNDFEAETSHVLSPNVIKSPTQKDFNYMFQWLYHRIDPGHKFLKNIDQEVPPILKQLRYPFERSITKSQLAAVGGQNWSTFLGLLHWMMQLTQMLEGYTAGKYDEACMEAGVDVSADKIMFDFLTNAYREFLSLDEEMNDEDAERALAPHVEAMATAFEHSRSRYASELEMLEAENARLLEEIEDEEKLMADHAAVLETLDDHYKILDEDRIYLEEFSGQATQKMRKYEARNQVLQEELDKLDEEVKEAREERDGLQRAVEAQGISMQDIDRMTAERERLQEGIDSAMQRLDEAQTKVGEREAEAGRKLDEVERMVDKCNNLAYQIALIPETAANAKGQDYELQVMDDSGSLKGSGGTPSSSAERPLADATTGYKPGDIINLDVIDRLRSRCPELRKEISKRRGAAMVDMMKDHELLEGIKEAIEDKGSEVEALKHRVRAAQEEYEKTKEVTTAHKMASDAQIEKMEKEISRMRAGLSESVQLMEQREINTTIEYEQMVLRASSLREELHTEIARILNDVIMFKTHIQESLHEYESFVADVLEKELGVEEAKEDTQTMQH